MDYESKTISREMSKAARMSRTLSDHEADALAKGVEAWVKSHSTPVNDVPFFALTAEEAEKRTAWYRHLCEANKAKEAE